MRLKSFARLDMQPDANVFAQLITSAFMFAVLLSVLLAAPTARAEKNKIEIAAGYYQLKSDGDGRQGSLSNFGVYRVQYHHGFSKNLEVALGYTVFFSDIISGDMGFGPDVGLIYFPLTYANSVELSTPDASLWFAESFRPFVGLAFHQRNYQSLDTSFAGFGFSMGTEVPVNRWSSFKGEVRYLLLGGPSNSSTNQLEALVGWVFSL